MPNASAGKRDFFVSFNEADRSWATWVAWVLEEACYSVWFQDWDFKGNFILEMEKAHNHSRRTVAVLSPDYLKSRFAAPEWAARFAQDATSEHDLLIPVRVRPCELEGLLAQIVYVDLVGCGKSGGTR
jgi:TIR domain